ncbi:MAG: T9SS type A sorting domain-containing protein [Flavobacteriales bacterium]|nr:T9SS type A sorting domain-containing protein [Flavobacteriales bacterium]
MTFRATFLFSFFLMVTTQLVAQVNCPPHLPLTLLGNTDYCVGSDGSQLSINESYIGYEWLPTSQTDQSVLLTAGNYSVVVTHYTGCTDTMTFQVNQVANPPQPTIDVSGPTQFCHGESVVLSVPTWYPYYEWNTGSISDEITIFESGTYVVSIEDWIGCSSSSVSVQITVDPLPTAAFSPNLNMFDIEFNNLSYDATSYEWNFGDGTTSIDFEPTHTFTTNDTLEMYLVAFNNCGSDTAFLGLESVGIEERTKEAFFSVYPNPNDGNFSIEIKSKTNASMVVSIYNSVGQAVFNEALGSGLGVAKIQAGNLADGIYLLAVRSENRVHTTLLSIKK